MEQAIPTSDRTTVVVAGATGFIGERLIARLRPSVRVHALSRRARTGFTEGPKDRCGSLVTCFRCRTPEAPWRVPISLFFSCIPFAFGSSDPRQFHDMDLILADTLLGHVPMRGLERLSICPVWYRRPKTCPLSGQSGRGGTGPAVLWGRGDFIASRHDCWGGRFIVSNAVQAGRAIAMDGLSSVDAKPDAAH